jgi:hypothetical protein
MKIEPKPSDREVLAGAGGAVVPCVAKACCVIGGGAPVRKELQVHLVSHEYLTSTNVVRSENSQDALAESSVCC